jgi:DNA-binding CsgD family transcriptional regulator
MRLLARPAWAGKADGGSRLTDVQVKQLVQVGIALRWVALALSGVAGLMAPKTPQFLVYMIIVGGAYNLVVMLSASRSEARSLRRLVPFLVLADTAFCYVFMLIYSVVPDGSQVAFYFPALIEAVAYYGALGAALSTALFFIPSAILAAEGVIIWRSSEFLGNGVIGASMIAGFSAAAAAAVIRVLMNPARQPSLELAGVDGNGAGRESIRLSHREQEVLHLISEGYSNTMIASRLNLSDSTVKGYVETLLVHLKAHNRAEAVAPPSRLKLL